MKIKIHPDYLPFRQWIEQVPNGEYHTETTFCKNRNTVEKVNWAGRPFVVKRYKRPTLANCVIYTWFRKTKARRAYENALHLLGNGIETARPVAYIEQRKWGFFHTGYFVSEYLDYPLVAHIQQDRLDAEEQALLKKDLIEFTLDLHRKRILPLDYNRGNIFYHKDNAHYRFALIDINRMRIGKLPDIKESMQAFGQLHFDIADYKEYVGDYARKRGFDLNKSFFFVLYSQLRWQWVHDLKKALKKAIGIGK